MIGESEETLDAEPVNGNLKWSEADSERDGNLDRQASRLAPATR